MNANGPTCFINACYMMGSNDVNIQNTTIERGVINLPQSNYYFGQQNLL